MLYFSSTRKVNWKGYRGMNEKFFDLKKEKQDRMINASLKVFAMNGYAHASTDDIVREAGISKGLLFHYFVSKLGLYSFIYDYSIRYVILELTTGVDKEETDYFRLVGQIREAELQVMRNYPCMMLFLNCGLRRTAMTGILCWNVRRNGRCVLLKCAWIWQSGWTL